MRNTLYIYCDEGVSSHSVVGCQHMIKTHTSYSYKTLNATQLIQGSWRHHAAAFIMPGGADLAYGRKLNGMGNHILKEYVHQGGTYIGLCAGAYYASQYCDFHRGDRGKEVLGARELAFYPGSAVGPTLAPYTYDSEAGACIAHLTWQDSQIEFRAYYNGGCHFPQAYLYPQTTVLACYSHQQPAIVLCQVGQGRALLSGVHPEYSPHILELMAEQYGEASPHYAKINNELIPALPLCDGSFLLRWQN